MTINSFQQQIQDVRYEYLDRKKERKADRFIGLWLDLKIGLNQKSSLRSIQKQEKALNKYFNQPVFRKLLEQDTKQVEQAIYHELLDSALIYQKACLEDRNYGSKLFNLIPMKSDELSFKAGTEVYQFLIAALLLMQPTYWRDQMITSLHLAHQEVFGENANPAEFYFEENEQDLFAEFVRIIQQTTAAQKA